MANKQLNLGTSSSKVDVNVSGNLNIDGTEIFSTVDTKISTAIANKADKNTTLSGYGITNAYTKDEVDDKLSFKADSNHSHDVVTSTVNGFMSADDKKKLDLIAAGANKYIHPAYTARTGKPTANQTPAFGGTATVSQITSDASGHVTGATDRTITIPSTLSNGTSTAGLIKTTSTVASTSGLTACPVISGVPYYKDTTYSSLKNPYSLTIQGNGTTLTNGVYDGSAAKTVNITPASLGIIDWFGSGTSIPSNADLNTYTTTGMYYAANESTAQTLANCPTTGNFKLYVFTRTTSNSIDQLLFGRNVIYIRGTNSSGTWSTWRKAGTVLADQSAALAYEITSAADLTAAFADLDLYQTATVWIQGSYFKTLTNNLDAGNQAHGYMTKLTDSILELRVGGGSYKWTIRVNASAEIQSVYNLPDDLQTTALRDQATVSNARARNITCQTTDATAGSSSLVSGRILFVYS